LPHRRHETERTCIVTRQTAPVDALIRFVVAPDGTVVPDFRRRLPGRGLWVTARADTVELAERRKLFARAHGGPVRIEPGLAGRVEHGLASAALSALSLARKAGSVITGFAKVETALARGEAVAVIHASDASADGVAKLSAAARRGGGAGKLAVIRSFSGAELDLALGRANVVHAALLAGPASQNLLARIDAWRAYRGEGRDAGEVECNSADGETSRDLASSGQRNE
jgi:uncharacterized protein